MTREEIILELGIIRDKLGCDQLPELTKEHSLEYIMDNIEDHDKIISEVYGELDQLIYELGCEEED